MNLKRLSKLKMPGFGNYQMKMPQLRIGDSIANVPIVQGGMGIGVSLSGLASAVADEGGIGVIAANAIGLLEPDYYANGIEANKRALRKQIRIARSKTSGIIGVNIMVALNDYHHMLQVAIDEKVDIVFLGAGLPLKGIPIAQLRNAGVKVVPIVSSGRAARLIFTYWQKHYSDIPDAVVVEGPQAGGHLGFKNEHIHDPQYALDRILPDVISALSPFRKLRGHDIPVIAAGGIYDGDDIFKFLKLGAAGVQMATRFVATHQCDADPGFKQAYLDCKEDDIMIIKSPVGLPGRAIRNNFLREVEAGKRSRFRCAWKCLESCDAGTAKYCISQALNNARLGKMKHGYAFAGANAYKVDGIVHVKELVKQLKIEYFKKLEQGTVNLRKEFEEALKNLAAFRDEYVKTLKKNVKSFKSELGDMMEQGSAALQEEHKKGMARLEEIKKEYAVHFERVNDLKEQISTFFDISRLKIPDSMG
jgi:nitronate monooxygenase